MKKDILIIGIMVFLGLIIYQSNKPKIAPQYKNLNVVVYGSDRCGLTQGVRKRLKAEGVPYTYRNIDKSSRFNNAMFDKVKQAGVPAGQQFTLPVVEVGQQVMVSARSDAVMEQVNALAKGY